MRDVGDKIGHVARLIDARFTVRPFMRAGMVDDMEKAKDVLMKSRRASRLSTPSERAEDEKITGAAEAETWMLADIVELGFCR